MKVLLQAMKTRGATAYLVNIMSNPSPIALAIALALALALTLTLFLPTGQHHVGIRALRARRTLRLLRQVS